MSEQEQMVTIQLPLALVMLYEQTIESVSAIPGFWGPEGGDNTYEETMDIVQGEVFTAAMEAWGAMAKAVQEELDRVRWW